MYTIGENLLPSDGMLSGGQVIESEMVNLWRGVRQEYRSLAQTKEGDTNICYGFNTFCGKLAHN